ECVTTLARAKVMPDLLFRTNHKAGCLFGSKWTEALVVTSGTLKLDVLTNHILDRQSAFDFLYCVHQLLPLEAPFINLQFTFFNKLPVANFLWLKETPAMTILTVYTGQ